MNDNRFEVTVLTKRGGTRIRYVRAETEGTARQHVLHSMLKADERILSIRQTYSSGTPAIR